MAVRIFLSSRCLNLPGVGVQCVGEDIVWRFALRRDRESFEKRKEERERLYPSR